MTALGLAPRTLGSLSSPRAAPQADTRFLLGVSSCAGGPVPGSHLGLRVLPCHPAHPRLAGLWEGGTWGGVCVPPHQVHPLQALVPLEVPCWGLYPLELCEAGCHCVSPDGSPVIPGQGTREPATLGPETLRREAPGWSDSGSGDCSQESEPSPCASPWS